jgi:hypothetical protein
MGAQSQFDAISEALAAKREVSAGSLFGKACIKLGSKAFAAFHKDEMVFKLVGDKQKEIMALKGAHLWDPSGAGRPMKEWTCLPVAHSKLWPELAEKALAHAHKMATGK